VKARLRANHNDRDVEFFIAKRTLKDYLDLYFHQRDLGSKSCEMIAEQIVNSDILPFISVAVYEDGENGAEVFI